MAILGQPYDPDVIRQLVDRQAQLEQRVRDIEGRTLLTTDRRSATADIVDPVEGQLVTFGTVVYVYTQGAWRPTAGCYEIKMAADDAEVTVAEFVFEIPPDLDGASLVFVRAYNTTAASGVTTVEVDNVTEAAAMLSTAVTIESGELSSKTAAVQPVIDTANNTVSEGDQIMVSVADVSDGMGTGVMLRFS